MKGYKVIHNDMVQGDNYFWEFFFQTKILFDIELIGPTLTSEEYRVVHKERVQGDP